MRGSVQGISWLTHWSYTSGPDSERIICPIQSVPGQPLLPPLSTPIDQGLIPAWTNWSETPTISSHVPGTCTPVSAKVLRSYHTVDLLDALYAMQYSLPSPVHRSIHA